MRFEIGDWVTGTTERGELVHGYIESIQSLPDTVSIHVVASDREASVGHEVTLRPGDAKALGESNPDRESLLGLIDLALATRDEAWFKELTARYAAIRDSGRGEARPSIPAGRNRIGYVRRDTE